MFHNLLLIKKLCCHSFNYTISAIVTKNGIIVRNNQNNENRIPKILIISPAIPKPCPAPLFCLALFNPIQDKIKPTIEIHPQHKNNETSDTTNPAISLGEIPVDHLDMLVDTLVGTSDPKPVYVKENGSFKMLYMAKVEYGQTAGYRQTDLIYAGDLIANIGESITSVLDKIKNMLVEFEYFYDVNG